MNPRSDGLSRVAGLAGPLVILVVLLGSTLVAVVRYTSLLDPDAPASMLGTMSSLHQPPAPCLRYPSQPQVSSVDEAVSALALAGFSASDVSELVGDLYASAAARELPLHARPEVEEYLDLMAHSSGWGSGVVVALKRDVLRDQLTRILFRSPTVTRTVASLPPTLRATLEAQWSRDPSVFVLPGLLRLVDALKVAATNRRLDAAKAALEAQLAAGEEPSLEHLAEGSDDWGAAFLLERTGDTLTLSSLGRDGAAGGTGLDEDLQRRIEGKLPPEQSAPVAAPCTEGTEFTLERAQLDGALQNSEALSKSVRVVPAFENGSPTGFRLRHLRSDSLFVRAGLCEGDVVRALNGVPLTSPDRALEAYSAMKDATRVEVSLTRAGAPRTLLVVIR